MDRRAFLEGAGSIAGVVAVAGCGSVAVPDGSSDEPTTGGRTPPATTDTVTRRPDPEAPSTRPTTERPADSTAQPTTTPDPPANRLLSAGEIGTTWRYADGSAPSEHGNGTITAVYVTADEMERLQTRLWPCVGESLANLGGTCSLGNLPERYRAMDGIETATPAVGETAFAWWSGSTTDIEVVAENHVFRTTYTTTRSVTATGDGAMAQERRLDRLVELAHRQTRKLARLADQ